MKQLWNKDTNTLNVAKLTRQNHEFWAKKHNLDCFWEVIKTLLLEDYDIHYKEEDYWQQICVLFAVGDTQDYQVQAPHNWADTGDAYVINGMTIHVQCSEYCFLYLAPKKTEARTIMKCQSTTEKNRQDNPI